MRSTIAIVALLFLLVSCGEQTKRVLVFSKTKGYRHESIDTAKLAIIELGKKNAFEVDTTEDASLFEESNLKRYSAVIFLSTTHDVLDPGQQAEFKRFIQAGGGYVGIHAAADTEYEWPWYGKLVGAYFKSHPKIQEAKVKKVGSLGTDTSPAEWTRTDEWYNYKNISDSIHVLYNLDETTYQGGINGENHPIAWYHDFDGGRSFYTGMGHTKKSYADPQYLDHLLQGIKYAMGEKSNLDYSKVQTKHVPEENRFTKTVLDFNLDEPTELTILPDGRIIFVERKGAVKLYDPKDGKVNLINTLKVGTKFEDGVIGITADPGFASNKWVYIFYSHPERSANVLSRFVFDGSKIDIGSEKEILEVRTQRETCCHTGGSLVFDSKGNLFISTGDNSSPFESDGYSPSDERPNRSPFDAQKSSANTNDLRGKILRIHPEPDGSYTIPEGNLFPKGEEKTRPEIYVMGTRNPYRISVDQKTGFLYWGEVGPDAGENDSLRGPRGYDEVNQARKAGFFGWPFFVGKNFPYAKYDFAAKKAGKSWEALHPINGSPNNTGKTELPAVSPPFIWYPYAKSEDFPMVKQGGRNAMAGPVYYSENFNGVATAFPDYFDGKLLIYDWMRGWMFLVTMNAAGDIADIEPFMEHEKFNNIIDMAYGPDGRLYMLEYGTAWFKQNIDARLVRIDYNGGNRPPVAKLAVNKTSGSTPLSVEFTAEGTMDHDKGDKITYELAADGKTLPSTDGKFQVTFDKPGVHVATLTAKDDKGLSSTAKVQVIAGNEPPVVQASVTSGNKTFFFPGTPVKYEVSVTDKEDGNTSSGKIPASDVIVTFDYLKGFDMTQIAQGHQVPSADLPGKILIAASDCKSCHMIGEKSAGPAYRDVANKYKGKDGVVGELAAKVIKGGAGVWGTTEMAAHPQISVDDAKKMVEYILTLADDKVVKKLPLAGTVTPGNEQEGVYMLTATYADKAVNSVPSLTAAQVQVLRAPSLTADVAADLKGATLSRAPDGTTYLDQIKNGSSASFKQIDLSGIKYAMPLVFKYGEAAEGELELHLDKPDGQLIGKCDFKSAKRTKVMEVVEMMADKIQLEPTEGVHDLYVVFKNPSAGDKTLFFFRQLGVSNK